MEIPSTIGDLVHFVGGEVVFVDTYDGITSYHCEQREGVRESELPIWVFNAFNVLEGMSFVSTAY